MTVSPLVDLTGKRGLIVGIANEHSIAAGCAKAFADTGASLAAIYLNDKARPFVQAVTDRLGCDLVGPCDVRVDGQLEKVFENIAAKWGAISISCCIRLHLRHETTCTVA